MSELNNHDGYCTCDECRHHRYLSRRFETLSEAHWRNHAHGEHEDNWDGIELLLNNCCPGCLVKAWQLCELITVEIEDKLAAEIQLFLLYGLES